MLLLARLLPALTLIGSLAIVGVGVSYFCWPTAQHWVRRALRIERDQEIGNQIRVGGLLLGGLLLFGLSTAGLISGRLNSSADRQGAAYVERARQALDQGRLDEAEDLLAESLAVRRARNIKEAQSLLTQVHEAQAHERAAQVERQAARLLGSAEMSIERKDFAEAAALLREYLAHANAKEHAKARQLLDASELVVSKAKAVMLLERMTDRAFTEWAKTGRLPEGLETGNPTLSLACREALYRQLPEAKHWRELARLAEESERRASASPEERQAHERAELEERLKQVGKERYDAAVAQYEAARRQYEADSEAYEVALARYEAARADYKKAQVAYEAAGRLRVARQFAKSSLHEEGEGRAAAAARLRLRAIEGYQEVIDKYAGTQAAADAGELLAHRPVPERGVPRPIPPAEPSRPSEPAPPRELVVSVEKAPEASRPPSEAPGSPRTGQDPDQKRNDTVLSRPAPSTPRPTDGVYSGTLPQPSGSKTVSVRGYYRKDGTFVRAHYRSPPGSGSRKK